MSIASAHDDDDKLSAVSQGSVTKQEVSCPYCNWAKQQRYLFKHIINNHHDELHQIMGTTAKIKEDLEDENLLRLYISIYSPDDVFKEFDKTPKPIYGCMACLNTYEHPGRAKAHWKKSTKCHQTHIKKVKAEMKRLQEIENNRGNDWMKDLSEKDLSFMIEKFRRYYYRLIIEDIPFLQKLPMNQGLEIPQKYLDYEFKDTSKFKNRLDMLEAFKLYRNFLHYFTIHITKKYTFPFDWKLPNPWDLSESYESAGLLPVGSSYEEYAKKRMEKSNIISQREEDRETISKLEIEKMNLLKELKNLEAQKQQEAPKPEAPKQEPPKLEPIPEIPKKEKRNSFTIPVPTPGSLVNQPIQTASFPTILSNTKVKRTPKTVS